MNGPADGAKDIRSIRTKNKRRQRGTAPFESRPE